MENDRRDRIRHGPRAIVRPRFAVPLATPTDWATSAGQADVYGFLSLRTLAKHWLQSRVSPATADVDWNRPISRNGTEETRPLTDTVIGALSAGLFSSGFAGNRGLAKARQWETIGNRWTDFDIVFRLGSGLRDARVRDFGKYLVNTAGQERS